MPTPDSNPNAKRPASDHALMSFGDHLDELRKRIIYALLGIIPIFFLAMALGKPVLEVLMIPIRASLRSANQPASLIATAPFEGFGTWFRVVLVLTILAGGPWIVYQLWRFIAPGLYNSEKRFAYLLMPMSILLTCVGVTFLYYVILPVILTFLITFGTNVGKLEVAVAPLPQGVALSSIVILEVDPPNPEVGNIWLNRSLKQLRVCIDAEPAPLIIGMELASTAGVLQQYRISEYVKMLLNFALAFGIAFQMPLVVLLLGWAGIVDRPWLAKYRRYVIAGCAIISAILTPADPLSMVLLALPLYGLFELGMLLLILLPADRVAGRSSRESRND